MGILGVPRVPEKEQSHRDSEGSRGRTRPKVTTNMGRQETCGERLVVPEWSGCEKE